VQEQPQSPAREAMTRSILDQIAQHAARQTGNVQTLSIELAPKFLGKISLVLTAAADGIVAKIRSESDAVRSLLSANLEALKLTLKDAGIHMKNIEVTEQNIGWDLARGQAGGMQWGSGPQNRYEYGENGRPPQDGDALGGIETETVQSEGAFYRTGRVAAPGYDEYDDTSFDYRA